MIEILILSFIFLIGMKIGLSLGYCIAQTSSENDTQTDSLIRKLMKIF